MLTSGQHAYLGIRREVGHVMWSAGDEGGVRKVPPHLPVVLL